MGDGACLIVIILAGALIVDVAYELMCWKVRRDG